MINVQFTEDRFNIMDVFNYFFIYQRTKYTGFLITADFC